MFAPSCCIIGEPRLRLFGEILVNAFEHRREVTLLQRARDELEERLKDQTEELAKAREQLAASEKALAERFSFEMLLAETSARFISLPAGRIDDEIEAVQRLVCERLGLDLSGLWQWAEETPRYFRLTHIHRPPGGPPLPERADAGEYFPWSLKQIEAGKVVAVSAEDAPPEAAVDRETWRRFGIKSVLVFPLTAGGGPLLGALSFEDMKDARPWSEPLVKRLELVAQTFANALARKHAEEELKKSYEEIRQLKDRLQMESNYLQTEIKSAGSHGESHPGCAGEGGTGYPDGFIGAHHRGNRNRQGIDCESDSQREQPQRPPHGGGQLRRPARGAGGERTLRQGARGLHRRLDQTGRPLRSRPRVHPLSGRDRGYTP
jgi:GAF domain-containing protein